MIRETLRLFRQAMAYALHSRHPVLWLFLVLSGVVAIVATIGAVSAPILIYPVL